MDWLSEDDTLQNKSQSQSQLVWKIVIVDDDPQVHNITKLSLSGFLFEEKKLDFISLYSGTEAKQYFLENDDISLVLLDVVMESDDAGLRVVDYLRKDLKNTYTRIVLRTGQPGLAPEQSIFQDYDIDGYIEKTSMTVNTLKQSIYIALRSYRDLLRIQNYQKGLEVVISAITNMNQLDDVMSLSKGILTQIASIFNMGHVQFLVTGLQGYTKGTTPNDNWDIIIKSYHPYFTEEDSHDHIEFKAISNEVLQTKSNINKENIYGYYYLSKRKTESVFILKTEQPLSNTAEKLLALYVVNVVITIENLLLTQ
jgi:CheY-like chemotaxis protein